MQYFTSYELQVSLCIHIDFISDKTSITLFTCTINKKSHNRWRRWCCGLVNISVKSSYEVRNGLTCIQNWQDVSLLMRTSKGTKMVSWSCVTDTGTFSASYEHWFKTSMWQANIDKPIKTRMWASAQRDGRPAEYRWCPMFNAAKFGWCPILECRAIMLPRRETSWNLQGYPKLPDRSQLLVGRSSRYCVNMWRRYCCLTSFFSNCRYVP